LVALLGGFYAARTTFTLVDADIFLSDLRGTLALGVDVDFLAVESAVVVSRVSSFVTFPSDARSLIR